MSSEAINAVWEYSNARADSKVVMLALADGADDHRLALLRVSFLARVCRSKESLVRQLLADLEVICEFHIIRRPRRDDAYLILLGLTWDKIYAALTRGIVRWGRGRALTEMAIIHQRVEGLFADPAKYGLCCKQLAALEQLREFPDEYRLYDEETWNSHPDTGESRDNS